MRISSVATSHKPDPHKYPRQHGSQALTRAQQYGAGMDILVQLTNSLASHGPVVIGGDRNTHASYTDRPWSAVSKMKAAGYGWANHSVDFFSFPQSQGARLANSWTGSMPSDHQWLTADRHERRRPKLHLRLNPGHNHGGRHLEHQVR